MLAHMLYNYRDCNDEDSILHLLIPKSKDKLSNDECRMFYLDKEAPDPNQMDLF